jgi:hypothetical protein
MTSYTPAKTSESPCISVLPPSTEVEYWKYKYKVQVQSTSLEEQNAKSYRKKITALVVLYYANRLSALVVL